MVHIHNEYKICMEELRKVKVRGRETSLKVNSYYKTLIIKGERMVLA